MAITYTDAYSELAVQQKRLKKSAELVLEFNQLYWQLQHDLGEHMFLALLNDWNIIHGWERGDRYRKWFHEDIAAGREAYADHLLCS